jgi:glyceraldehyde-3-phosphate dehydrogenase/erythrose-4-phosphate dehydrogenase
MPSIASHGFGRIGRSLLRVALRDGLFVPAAVSHIKDVETLARAFRWEESTGMVDLGSTVPGRSSRADGVSGDGRIVVGFQESALG